MTSDLPSPIISPVILSGGQGLRLWPLSRENEPKQFIPLISDRSLFEETILRCKNRALFGAPLVLCSQQHRYLVKKLLTKIGQSQSRIIMEPLGKNTAAAVCAAALAAGGTDDILLILPSDHYIPDVESFLKTVESAVSLVVNDRIVTFGVMPTSAYTGFGYIERGEPFSPGYFIKSFHEKPNKPKAELYFNAGTYYWNAGILMARADTLLKELGKHAPDILNSVKNAWDRREADLGDILLNADAFAAVRSQSIDYAVLEKTECAAVVPANFEWNDLGSWDAIWGTLPTNEAQNFEQGNVYTQDVCRSYLRSEGPILAVLGLSDIIAVAMPDAVLVAPKDKSEDVKALVEKMGQNENRRVVQSRKVLRPWGHYETIEQKAGHHIKKLVIDPGCSISLQNHECPGEHLIVVAGTATITRQNEVFELAANEAVYISGAIKHHLENQQKVTLEIIQVGVFDKEKFPI